jgi:hypothetical protein
VHDLTDVVDGAHVTLVDQLLAQQAQCTDRCLDLRLFRFTQQRWTGAVRVDKPLARRAARAKIRNLCATPGIRPL